MNENLLIWATQIVKQAMLKEADFSLSELISPEAASQMDAVAKKVEEAKQVAQNAAPEVSETAKAAKEIIKKTSPETQRALEKAVGKSKLGLILGLSIGAPLGLAGLGLGGWALSN